MEVAIIKYNAGNIRSVEHALHRLGIAPVITDDPEVIQSADRVIFPGVGEAKNTMAYLKAHRIDQLLIDLKQPVLGICLGMQLMCQHSEEGDVDLLNIFDQPVLKFQTEDKAFKIPHMGWNNLLDTKGDLMQGVSTTGEDFVYFVHSYYVPLCDDTIATTDYIQPFSAALHKDNYYATQFHPEKSAGVGERILSNFIQLND